jgi:hypothetical protein
MHDLGGLIWVIIVLIAVFSSIRKNVQQARKTMQQQRPAMQQQGPAPPVHRPAPQPASQPPAPPTPTPLQRAFEMSPVTMSPVAPPAPTPAPAPRAVAPIPAPASATAPIPPLPHDPFHTSSIQRRSSSGLLGGIFEDKNSILRAVVAAEVLGKPKALQEQSIWSPRHSEPSI